MKLIIGIAGLLFLTGPLNAQTYAARTDLNKQPYPVTIPCPGPSCSGGGSLSGANTVITPSDFNTPIIRITDVNTAGGSGQGNVNSFGIDSSAEVNFMNKNDDRFIVSSGAEAYIPYIWNGSTKQATQMYVSSFPSTGGYVFGSQVEAFPFWSFTQPYIVYTVEFTSGGNPAIYSYDFTSTTVAPTRQLLIDLSSPNCVPAMAGVHPQGVNFTVSADDQTFALNMGTNGSTGLIYAVIWNRTNGCRVWNTSTGAITGAWGTTGTIAISDRLWQHNERISLDGNWIRIDEGQCTAGGCMDNPADQVDNIYFWNIPSLTITEINATTGVAVGGHQANGYTHIANEGGPNNATFKDGSWRAYATPSIVTDLVPSSTIICTSNGAAGACSGHETWANDLPGDTTPIFETGCSNTGAVIGYTWDSEIIGISTDGSQKVYRFSHTYGSCASQFFSALVTIGSVSQSGKWFAWSSDWMGMLGNTSDSSASCTIGTNCRADVFMVPLSAGTASSAAAPQPPTNLTVQVE